LETKQEVLRLLIERIVVTDEALTVEHIIPTVNSRLHDTCRGACCVVRVACCVFRVRGGLTEHATRNTGADKQVSCLLYDSARFR